MDFIFIKLTKGVIAVLMALFNIFSFTPCVKEKSMTMKKEDCRLCVAELSDVHLSDLSLFEWLLSCGLSDCQKAKKIPDALIFNGDNTNLGSEKEYARFQKAVSSYAEQNKIYLSVGNHDTWCGSWDGSVRTPEESVTRFSKYLKFISKVETDKPYYSVYVNGYMLIFLGSEGNGTGAHISDEQVSWLDMQLQEATKEGLPVFIFLHQSLNGTHGLPYNWEMEQADANEGGIGNDSDAVLAVIQKYKNVFYISGHIHAGFSKQEDKNCYESIEQHDGYTLVNLPSYVKCDMVHGGVCQIGTGYVMEVYENEVIFRARNFITQKWLTAYETAIPLV